LVGLAGEDDLDAPELPGLRAQRTGRTDCVHGAGPAPVCTAKPFQLVASQTDSATQLLEAGLNLNSSTLFLAKLVMTSVTGLKY
jgi:hypothetical protein